MNKVYVLIDDSDLKGYVCGVFANRNDLEAFITKTEEDIGEDVRLLCKVEEWTLGEGVWFS